LNHFVESNLKRVSSFRFHLGLNFFLKFFKLSRSSTELLPVKQQQQQQQQQQRCGIARYHTSSYYHNKNSNLTAHRSTSGMQPSATPTAAAAAANGYELLQRVGGGVYGEVFLAKAHANAADMCCIKRIPVAGE
jgi:hypothetical protein